MTDSRLPLIAAAAALALGACGSEDVPVSEHADESVQRPDAATASNTPAAIGKQTELADSFGRGRIPAPLHGRWGLTPADCEARSGTAEGLLVVTGEDLLFYESRAVPASSIEADGDSIAGDFAFTGEGMTEQRFQSLQLDGDQLVRAGNGPSGSFTYVRCEPESR